MELVVLQAVWTKLLVQLLPVLYCCKTTSLNNLFSAIARANNWTPEWEEIMPGHRSFLRIGNISPGLISNSHHFGSGYEFSQFNKLSFLFPNRYNYYPKLEKAWTFGEKDEVPLRRVFKLVF